MVFFFTAEVAMCSNNYFSIESYNFIMFLCILEPIVNVEPLFLMFQAFIFLQDTFE